MLHPKHYVKEVLAYSMFESYISDERTRKNFIRFLYACIKEEAEDMKADDEYYGYSTTLTDCVNFFLFESLHFLNQSVRDFFCEMYHDKYTPDVCDPLVFQFDPTYQY